jgi:ABC-type Fe3+-siderophore transport system permease subunit
MAKRRAGQRLRNQARARRHELIGLLWKQLLAGTIVWFAFGVVSALFIGLFYGRLAVAFVMGVYAGAYASLGFLHVPRGRPRRAPDRNRAGR